MVLSKNSFMKKNLYALIKRCTQKALSYDDIKAKEKDDGTIVTNADIEINSLIKKILNCYILIFLF